VSCGGDGVFEFRDVPPGDYYVIAFDRVKWSPEADTFLATLTRNQPVAEFCRLVRSAEM
jgi:hypothetical protein